jgi:hypothetical protein
MKRTWYIPGMISLVLLLPLTQWKLEKDREARIETCLSIEFLGTDPNGEDQDVDSLPNRKWTVLQLTNRSIEEHGTITQFKERIKKLKADLDSTEGVVLSLPRGLRYDSFINAIEVAENDSVGSLVVNEKEIRWYYQGNEKAIAPIPLPEQAEFDIECGYDYFKYNYVPTTYWASQRIPGRFRYSLSPIWLLWLALATLSIVRLRRNNAPS